MQNMKYDEYWVWLSRVMYNLALNPHFSSHFNDVSQHEAQFDRLYLTQPYYTHHYTNHVHVTKLEFLKCQSLVVYLLVDWSLTRTKQFVSSLIIKSTYTWALEKRLQYHQQNRLTMKYDLSYYSNIILNFLDVGAQYTLTHVKLTVKLTRSTWS